YLHIAQRLPGVRQSLLQTAARPRTVLAHNQGLPGELLQGDSLAPAPRMLCRHDQRLFVSTEGAVFQIRVVTLSAEQAEVGLALLDLTQDGEAVVDRCPNLDVGVLAPEGIE